MTLMYLRKSRADDPNESVEEVLSRHETILQDFAEKNLGGRIDEKYIYREVASGESIAERNEIQAVLRLIEHPEYDSILVVEPQRLSRGDLVDCGTLIKTLSYTNTKVITPMMTYDCQKEFDRRFFQDELIRGHDFLEYVKRILYRGRKLSAAKGNYVCGSSPYGYDIKKENKKCFLVPNDSAKIVRMIFDDYLGGKSTRRIADSLNAMKIPTAKGKEHWSIKSVNNILSNEKYTGKITFGKITEEKFIDMGIEKSRKIKREEYITVDDAHVPIVSKEEFQRVQQLKKSATSERNDFKLNNVFAHLMYCDCGKPIRFLKKHNEAYYMYDYCHCYKGFKFEKLEHRIYDELLASTLPDLKANIKKRQLINLNSLEKELTALKKKESRLFDLVESGTYTKEMFEQRYKSVREGIEALETRINAEKQKKPSKITDDEVKTLCDTIKSFYDDSIPAKLKNQVLQSFIEKIVVRSFDDFIIYLKL